MSQSNTDTMKDNSSKEESYRKFLAGGKDCYAKAFWPKDPIDRELLRPVAVRDQSDSKG